MKQNSVSAAVMTAPGKFEVRRYPYPDVDDVSMVIELEMCGLCGTDKHTFRGETVQYAGTPAESHTPFPIIPGHEIVGKVAEIGKTASHSLEYARTGAQDRRPGRHVSRHSLRQVLVLPEHVRLSAVPEHQRLRQRLHLRGQPASHGRLGRLYLCPQGRLRVQGPRGHGAAHRGHVRTHDLHLQSRQGQRALHHGRGRLRLRRDDRRPGRGSPRPPACAQSPADGRRHHHRDRPFRFPASTGEGFRRRCMSSA